VSELKQALLAIFRGSGREHVFETFRQVVARDPEAAKAFGDPQTMDQVSLGYFNMIVEYLEGEKREVRDYWIDTFSPALVEQGQTLVDISREGVMFSVILAVSIVSELPPELRIEGTAWAAGFHSGVQADMTRAVLGKLGGERVEER